MYELSVSSKCDSWNDHAPHTCYADQMVLAMYLVSNDKRGISAVQLQYQIGVTYKPAWYMLKRIREAMKNRDDSHQLEGVIEFDDAFFG